MRQLIYRVHNKIRKELKKKARQNVPFQTETTFSENSRNWYEPVLAGPSTFVNDCTSSKTVSKVLEIVQKLTEDEYLSFTKEFYKNGLKRFGENWRYADINTVLYGICQNMKINHYLEIGVRRGRSMSIVASLHPKASILGFDMWIPNYVGIENPGPQFVASELGRVGYQGDVQFISGNSHKTVPRYFRENPNAYFDMITVDGDHTYQGAIDDLKTVIPRLKVGGLLVFDDICNSEHTYLKKVWNKITANKERFQTYEYEELGYGVAFAIKRY